MLHACRSSDPSQLLQLSKLCSEKAISALKWVVKEMESRYRLMTKEGVRNIDGYNSKHKLPMPYIVVIVDEMSDLMLVSGKEIEGYIQKGGGRIASEL